MTNSSSSSSSSPLSQSEQEELIKKLQIFKIQGRDKRGHPLLLVTGKLFPARLVNMEAVKKYMDEEIFPSFGAKKFSVVYLHTGANRGDNFPGISGLKIMYEAIPVEIRENLDGFYFVHPGIQSRLFLATFGRILFTGTAGLYGKLRYVNRLEFLWDNIRRNEVEIPDFVYEFDEEMEYRPTMDYGIESDHPGVAYAGPTIDGSVSTYSMRCIA